MNDHEAMVRIIRDNRSAWVTNTEHAEMEAAQAAAILAAGYRKAEPAWEPSLLNDGVYEYTQTGSCDGSIVYNYRRLPRLQYEGEFPSWESYEPEAAL